LPANAAPSRKFPPVPIFRPFLNIILTPVLTTIFLSSTAAQERQMGKTRGDILFMGRVEDPQPAANP